MVKISDLRDFNWPFDGTMQLEPRMEPDKRGKDSVKISVFLLHDGATDS